MHIDVQSNWHCQLPTAAVSDAHCVCCCAVQVLLDEFNAKPMPVTVTGSAVAGLARDRLVAAVLGSSSGAGMLQHTGQLTNRAAGMVFNKGGGTTRGGEQSHVPPCLQLDHVGISALLHNQTAGYAVAAAVSHTTVLARMNAGSKHRSRVSF
jgi:hypothetical protein